MRLVVILVQWSSVLVTIEMKQLEACANRRQQVLCAGNQANQDPVKNCCVRLKVGLSSFIMSHNYLLEGALYCIT